MIRNFSRTTWTAAALLAVGVGLVLTASSAQANGPLFVKGKPVVDNYYSPPGTDAGVGAQMYVCPRYVPPLVGYTYISYPEFAPHENLYHHSEVHVNGLTLNHARFGGWNVARNVHWAVHGLPNMSTKFQ